MDFYFNWGIVLEVKGEFKVVIVDYNWVLVVNLEDVFVYNNWGNVEGGLGNWISVLEDFQ